MEKHLKLETNQLVATNTLVSEVESFLVATVVVVAVADVDFGVVCVLVTRFHWMVVMMTTM